MGFGARVFSEVEPAPSVKYSLVECVEECPDAGLRGLVTLHGYQHLPTNRDKPKAAAGATTSAPDDVGTV